MWKILSDAFKEVCSTEKTYQKKGSVGATHFGLDELRGPSLSAIVTKGSGKQARKNCFIF